MASAAARIDSNRLLVTVDDGLYILDLVSEIWESYLEIESDNSLTRGNDCRVHQSGSFWFGTMGHKAVRVQDLFIISDLVSLNCCIPTSLYQIQLVSHLMVLLVTLTTVHLI